MKPLSFLLYRWGANPEIKAQDDVITLREASVLFECELSACASDADAFPADVGRDRAGSIKFLLNKLNSA
jgi:hypothetical protein